MFLHGAIYRTRRRLALWSAITILSATLTAILGFKPDRQINGLDVSLYIGTLVAAAFAHGNYQEKCRLDNNRSKQTA